METFTLDVDYLVVSISTPESLPAKMCRDKYRRGILRLWFDDADHESESMRAYFERNLRLFNTGDAFSILNFVRTALMYTNVEAIVCHCDAGISRSSATAAALSKILNGDDFAMFQKPYVPNMLVYRTLLTVNHETKLLRKWEKRNV